MLTGSSALLNESTQQVTNPKLRVTLRSNTYGVRDSYSGTGKPTYDYGAAIVFKDKAFLGKNVWSKGMTGWWSGSPIPVADAFLNLGDTVVAYGGVSMNSVVRYYSNNGLSWSAGETLFTGSSVIDAICVTDEDTIYFRERCGRTDFIVAGSLAFRFNYFGTILKSRVKDGATWREYTIDSDLSWNHGSSGADLSQYGSLQNAVQPLIGARRNDEDHLFYLWGSSVGNKEPNDNNYELRAIVTDGVNLLSKETMFSPINDNAGIRVLSSDLGIGSSYYYMAISTRITDYVIDTDWQGTTSYYTDGYGVGYMKSADLKHWTYPVLSNWMYDGGKERYGIFDLAVFETANTLNVLVAEDDEFEIRIVNQTNNSQNVINLFKGTTEVDISDNIMKYANKNNERITLTLGNYA